MVVKRCNPSVPRRSRAGTTSGNGSAEDAEDYTKKVAARSLDEIYARVTRAPPVVKPT